MHVWRFQGGKEWLEEQQGRMFTFLHKPPSAGEPLCTCRCQNSLPLHHLPCPHVYEQALPRTWVAEVRRFVARIWNAMLSGVRASSLGSLWKA